jgi:hypothetical protein
MTRIRILSIALLCSLAACQPTVDTVARDAAVCNLPPISPTMWDGKTFPAVVSDAVSIYLAKQCVLDAKYAFAMVVDDTKVASVVKLLPEQIGSYVSQALAPCPQTLDATGELHGNTSDLRCLPVLNVVKIPCGPRPPGLTAGNGVLPVNLNAAFHDAYDLLSAEIDAGQLCPGKQ